MHAEKIWRFYEKGRGFGYGVVAFVGSLPFSLLVRVDFLTRGWVLFAVHTYLLTGTLGLAFFFSRCTYRLTAQGLFRHTGKNPAR